MTHPLNVINLSAGGQLQASGNFSTSAEEVSAILTRFAASGKESMTLYFHGGLVAEQTGLNLARQLSPMLEDFDTFPVFFVWETGVLESIQSRLEDITEGSPIFHKLLSKVMKHAGRWVGKAGGAGDDTLEVAPIDERADELRTILEQLENESVPLNQPDLLTPLEPAAPEAMPDLSDAEVDALLADLENDEEANRQLQTIIDNARAQTQESTLEAAPVGTDRSVGYLSSDILHEITQADATQESTLELVGIPTSVWFFAGRVLKSVISRYRAGADHGLQGTVMEEIYRGVYFDKIGVFLWDSMKERASEAYTDNGLDSPPAALHGGTLFLDQLKQHMEQHPTVKVNLIGHSAGSIHICHFMERAARTLGPDFIANAVIFWAPAVNFTTFTRGIVANSSQIRRFRIFTMDDEAERNDPLVKGIRVIYPHSLLYLVSGILESAPDTPLVGLARHLEGERYSSDPDVKAARAFFATQSAPAIIYSPSRSEPQEAAFSSHYGPDHGPNGDRATIASSGLLIRAV